MARPLDNHHAKRAAKAGVSAFAAFRAAHGPAKLAARLPVIGPLAGVAVLAGATVFGAISGFSDDGEDA